MLTGDQINGWEGLQMTTFNVYANGVFWGAFDAYTAEAAMQVAADEHGTVDIGEARASTEGMTAVPVESHRKLTNEH